MAGADSAGWGLRDLPEMVQREGQRQKVLSRDMVDAFDGLAAAMAAVRERLRGGDVDTIAAIKDLQQQAAAAEAKVAAAGRTRHESLADATEQAGDAFAPVEMYQDVDADGRPWEQRRQPILQIIGAHLHAAGMTDTAAVFEAESREAIPDGVKMQHSELRHLLEAVKGRDIAAIQAWLVATKQKVAANALPPFRGPGHVELTTQVEDLEFSIHKMCAVGMIRRGERLAALAYIKEHFLRHQNDDRRWGDVSQLVGSLAFIRDDDAQSDSIPVPYAFVRGSIDALWDEVAQHVTECWHAVTQTPKHPHLTLALAAGAEVMPTLQRYVTLPAAFRRGNAPFALPVLPREMLFRSSISCPVTQQVTTPGDGPNPAMMLPCSHVISRAAVESSLVRAMNHMLKCPYCPCECRQSDCQPLFL